MKDMGKQTEDKLKVIFKTSLTTLCTHSKTCSGISQLSTKSGILRIQKSLRKKHSYYLDTRGKLKRDLSIETDICVLRRFCRQKINKTSNLESSAKSRYSAVDTEAETVEEYPDASACGDNEIIEIRSNHPTNLEGLMVDNLRNLLGQWIQNRLMSRTETKQKLDMVFDSILHKLKDKSEQELSSDTTYVIHKEAHNQEVKNKKTATAFSCPYCKRKSCRKLVTSTSSQKDLSSAPLTSPKKDLRIISTLSIPRTFNKRGLDVHKKHTSSCKLGKIKPKNIIISMDKFSKLLDSSSFDLLAVSTKSLTKGFANCDNLKKKRHIVFFPKPFYRSVTCSASILKLENIKDNKFDGKKYQLDTLPSLLRSLYKNDSAIINSSVDKNVQFNAKNDNSTMTNCENTSREIINKAKGDDIGTENQMEDVTTRKCSLTINRTTYTSTSHMTFLNKKFRKQGKINKRRRQVFGNKISPHSSKLRHFNSKHFTFMHEKATKQILQGQELLKYWQSLFQYFNENNGKKKIKVDIHVSLSPMSDYETKDKCTDTSKELCNAFEIKGDPTLLYNMKQQTETSEMLPIIINSQLETGSDITLSSPTFVPKIIPLLDGAISQAKYILDGSSKEKIVVNSNMVQDRCTVTSDLEILQEISELKVVIKDLAMTTERLVSKELRKDFSNSYTYTSNNASCNYTSSSRCEAVINLINSTKATQVSTDFKNCQTKSHIDTREGSKTKDTLEYYNRLTKKSTSFRIIESESLLRVTDMTSKADEINKFNRQLNNEALMCSMPKSMSLLELPTERNKKLIAFFCDNCVTPNYCKSARKGMPRPMSSKACAKNKKQWCFWGKSKKKDICCPRAISGSSCVLPMGHDGAYSSTSSCHSANSVDDEDQLGPPCKRPRGMGFGEGCMYCMLLWIPVIILGCLFYSHVLKDLIVPTTRPMHAIVGKRTAKPVSSSNSTVVYLKLSDLGF